MVSKATKRKVDEFWNHQCAICGNKDFLEYHHLTEKNGSDDYDNLILLYGCCHAKIHKMLHHFQAQASGVFCLYQLFFWKQTFLYMVEKFANNR